MIFSLGKNTAFRLSGVETSINVVHSDIIYEQYNEHDDLCVIKDKMKSSNEEAFVDVRKLRDEHKADLVGLIVGNRSSFCGCGSLPAPSQWLYNTSEEAYFVATVECSVENLSFAHELGHAFVSTMLQSTSISVLYRNDSLN
jgi:hypothetical protein